MREKWKWFTGGIMLGLVFLLAVWIVKPIGASTQYVIFDGIIWNLLDSELIDKVDSQKQEYSSTNSYFNKSNGKYAKNIANPLNYSFIFVISMFVGGFISNLLLKKKTTKEDKIRPKVWLNKFGESVSKRYVYSFIGGFLVLFGSRLAGGCTSGHMMSGMMQTSLSGYIFAFGVFAVAIPFAILFFKQSKN